MKAMIFIMVISMALGVSLSSKNVNEEAMKPLKEKRVIGRFLAYSTEKNPRAADHCRKDNEVCYMLEGKNSTCCNNKCEDLDYDNKNCGACKNKCKYGETCCRGECVNVAYDKRHCGKCNNRCTHGCYCIYGLCDYA
ncbi:hypothetical protein Leryth_013971 [Lithospermum erythrorhizon]|nr:hypothetical protein Leryth_013971 [Lithospermum erythrorhizon]